MKKISEQQGTTKVQTMPLISIIVPVYQVKEYIEECVESLLAQTYTNLEILLVDDGSTDGSGAMCDEYAVKDSRVRVIHQENQGPSVARNQGLDHARGEYVAFVDSDDVVMPDFIETLFGILNKYQADIAACAYIKCSTDDLIHIRNGVLYIDSNDNKEICMTSEQMLRQWHGKYKKWETVAWNKLYRKSVLNGGNGVAAIRFPVGRKLEDVLMSHLMVANAARVVLTMRKLYLYRTTPNSRAYQSRMAKLMEENLRAQRERMAFFKERRYWMAYFNLLVGYMLHLAWFEWKRMKQRK
ncbi:MAG: glycosyltransferase [Lachnospiraceae bacterium]|nr:glycosyltransferase [Lachnospiraceae bacterium]MDE7179343.1 glycosyltransferase [Lachnospiraceae bacterium]